MSGADYFSNLLKLIDTLYLFSIQYLKLFFLKIDRGTQLYQIQNMLIVLCDFFESHVLFVENISKNLFSCRGCLPAGWQAGRLLFSACSSLFAMNICQGGEILPRKKCFFVTDKEIVSYLSVYIIYCICLNRNH